MSRTPEQTDRIINVLLERVIALEQTVARLGGSTMAEASKPAPSIVPEDTLKEKLQESSVVNSPTPEKVASVRKEGLESAIGTRWIGRIGIVAIIFSIGFFLKYSFDNGLIGVSGRVIIGILTGAIFLWGGEFFQRRKGWPLYGQMISGGGLAILHLSLYAAFSMYHIIPVFLAFAGMVTVTTTGMTLSIRYSGYPLAVMALLGGLFTPFMLSTGNNRPIELFSYLLLLTVGASVLHRIKRWGSLPLISLAGVSIIYALWHGQYFSRSQHGLAFCIITLFFLFHTLSVLQYRMKNSELPEDRIEQMILAGSAMLYLVAALSQYDFVYHWGVRFFVMALAAFEISLAYLFNRRGVAPVATFTTAGVSLVLTVVAIFTGLEKDWILPALSTEMAVLVFLGFRSGRPGFRLVAYLLLFPLCISFLDGLPYRIGPFEKYLPIFNTRFLISAVAIAGIYAMLAILRRHAADMVKNERYIVVVLFGASQILSLILLSTELHDMFRYRQPGYYMAWGAAHHSWQVSLSVLYALYGSILTWAGISRRLLMARVFGMALLGITIVKVFIFDLSDLQAVYRIVSFMVLGLLLLGVSYIYNRYKNSMFGDDQP